MGDREHERDDDGATPPRDWLTYRYRLGGDGRPEASGTIKAPSFSAAARRLLDGRLADRVGAVPAFLRLRAAGQDEMLLRVGRDASGLARLDVLPADAFRFAPPTLGGTDAG